MTEFCKFALIVTTAICMTALGCGGSSTHTPTELHDQKGEHLNYPAGGPNSPEYKNAAGKANKGVAPKDAAKEAAPAEKKQG